MSFLYISTSNNTNKISDETDKSASTSNKFPFSSMHNSADDNFAPSPPSSSTHGKCPFLQKTVKMFDYSDEKKPKPHKVTLLTQEQEEENANQLHCAIFKH